MRFISLRLAPLALAVLLVTAVAPLTYAQRDWDRARTLVGASQRDLSQISEIATMSGKERERYDNALHHLSEFDQGLAHSRFDKGKLDDAIGDVDNVCKNNTLAPGERDVLLNDLRQLRDLRADWKD
jgi:hypothetical protein